MNMAPCAHCGGTAVPEGTGTSPKRVKCLGCGVSTRFYRKIAEAVAAWNRRVRKDRT